MGCLARVTQLLTGRAKNSSKKITDLRRCWRRPQEIVWWALASDEQDSESHILQIKRLRARGDKRHSPDTLSVPLLCQHRAPSLGHAHTLPTEAHRTGRACQSHSASSQRLSRHKTQCGPEYLPDHQCYVGPCEKARVGGQGITF